MRLSFLTSFLDVDHTALSFYHLREINSLVSSMCYSFVIIIVLTGWYALMTKALSHHYCCQSIFGKYYVVLIRAVMLFILPIITTSMISEYHQIIIPNPSNIISSFTLTLIIIISISHTLFFLYYSFTLGISSLSFQRFHLISTSFCYFQSTLFIN